MNTLYIKLILAVIFVVGVTSGILYVRNLQNELEEKKSQLTELSTKYARSQDDLENATKSKAALVAATTAATIERTRIQGELTSALARLRTQKPPVECKAAIDWAIENKHDLSF